MTPTPCESCREKDEEIKKLGAVNPWVCDQHHKPCCHDCMVEMCGLERELKEKTESHDNWVRVAGVRKEKIVSQLAQLAAQADALELARTYSGLEARACPLCRYDDGVFVSYCSMHKQINDQAEMIDALETSNKSLSFCVEAWKATKEKVARERDAALAAIKEAQKVGQQYDGHWETIAGQMLMALEIPSKPSPEPEPARLKDAAVEAIKEAWPCSICRQKEVGYKPHDGTCASNASGWQSIRGPLAALDAESCRVSQPKDSPEGKP